MLTEVDENVWDLHGSLKPAEVQHMVHVQRATFSNRGESTMFKSTDSFFKTTLRNPLYQFLTNESEIQDSCDMELFDTPPPILPSDP